MSRTDAMKRGTRMAKMGMHGDAREELREALKLSKTVDEKLQVFDAARTLIESGTPTRRDFETYAKIAIDATGEAALASETTQAALKAEWAATLAAKDLTRDAFSLAGFHPLQALKLLRIASDARLSYRGIDARERFDNQLRQHITERQLWK